MKKKKIKGIWFYGLSGSGKTYASNFLFKKVKNSILLDGDLLRKMVSFDLGYSKKDRLMQNKRVFGIAKIAMLSGIFPIVSSVYLDKNLAHKIKKKIIVIQIIRSLSNVNLKLKKKRNVVGKDICLPKIKSVKITNDSNFKKKLIELIK
jgi:adenylylsulfate kinase-like enzyme